MAKAPKHVVFKMSQHCIINIGAQERKKRLTFGKVTFVVTLVLSALFIFLKTPATLHLALAPLFLMSGLGFFQAKEKT